jgi:uncharacterized protein YqeY
MLLAAIKQRGSMSGSKARRRDVLAVIEMLKQRKDSIAQFGRDAAGISPPSSAPRSAC